MIVTFRPLIVMGILMLAGVGPALAQGDPLDEVQAMIAAGDRSSARATLDSLLSDPQAVGGTTRPEAEFLRVLLEESGEEYGHRLRSLLDHDLLPARESWVHLSLGQMAFVQGDLQFALREFIRCRELGRQEECGLWEGLTAYALGDGDAARTALGLVQNSGNPEVRARARIAIGNTYRAGGDWSSARTHYRKVREDDEGSTWWGTAVLLEARCLEELGEADEAKDLLRKLIADVPEGYEIPLARNRFSNLLAMEGDDGPGEVDGGGGEDGDAGFAVQVGAFSSSENAEGMAGEIREQGIDEVRIVAGDDGLHRVLLGRFSDRIEAESYGDSLGAALGLGFSVVEEN
jgi:tetratricopeptide (TPR) repeat protein